MRKPPRQADEPDGGQPLVGRIVHGLVVCAGIVGGGWFGWSLGNSFLTRSALALAGGALLSILWFGFYSRLDPETKPFAFVELPGRAVIVIEVLAISIGGAALWLAWHRAAGETYWTFATLDLAVRYQRLTRLWNNQTSSSDTER